MFSVATATVIIDTSIEGGSSQVTADGVWFYNDILASLVGGAAAA
jgi:hypothetical protein